MDFNQKFEPKGNKIIHGAGQSVDQFKKYWNIMGDCKPLIYMAYARISEIQEKLPGKIDSMIKVDENLCLQLGLNLKPKGDKEKCEEIALGKYDDEIIFLINTLKGLKNPVFLRLGYECNNPAHEYNPKKFVNAWRYIVAKFRENNVQNIAFVWSVCTAFTRDLSALMNYYPGDEYVDWFGDDLFGVRHFTEKDNPQIITGHFCNEAENHGKPLMIGEASPAKVGVDNGRRSWDGWFKPFFQWIADHPVIKAFCYIDWDWGKDWKNPEWLNGRIEENEIVLQEYLNELKNNKYLHNKDFARLYSNLRSRK